MNDPSGVYYVYYSSKTLLLGPKYGAFAKSTRIYTQNEFEMWCLLQGASRLTDIFTEKLALLVRNKSYIGPFLFPLIIIVHISL